MAGRGGVVRSPDGRKIFQQDPSLAELPASVWSFHGGIWQQAIEPIHAEVDNLKTCGYGPGPFFGGLLVGRGLSNMVGLVPCAVGGTEIDEWREGSHLFNQMMDLTKEAREAAPKGSILKALLWYQGESDCDTEEKARAWGLKFGDMLVAFRRRVLTPDNKPLPVYMVIVSCQNSKVAGYLRALRIVQSDVDAPTIYKVDAARLELQEDGLHLTTTAQQSLAARLADAFTSAALQTKRS